MHTVHAAWPEPSMFKLKTYEKYINLEETSDKPYWIAVIHMSHITIKPVFRSLWPSISNQHGQLLPWNFEFCKYRYHTIQGANSKDTDQTGWLRGCAGWSASLLFAYGINSFSQDVAHMHLMGNFTKWNFTAEVLQHTYQSLACETAINAENP